MTDLSVHGDFTPSRALSATRRRAGACVSFLLAAGIWATFSAAAFAQSDHTIGGIRPEVHGSVGGHGDLGAGFRVDIPIVPEGFISGANDEFALSPGLDIQFVDLDGHDHLLLIPQLAVQWNFYFRRPWSIFPELGAAIVFGSSHHGYHDDDVDVHVDPLFAFGARYHFSARNALILRAGFPSGFQIGVSF